MNTFESRPRSSETVLWEKAERFSQFLRNRKKSLAMGAQCIWSSTLTLRWQFEVNYVSFTIQQRLYSSLHLCLWKVCNNSDLITQTVQPLSQLDFAWKLHIAGHSFGCSPKPHTVNSCAVFHSGCSEIFSFLFFLFFSCRALFQNHSLIKYLWSCGTDSRTKITAWESERGGEPERRRKK